MKIASIQLIDENGQKQRVVFDEPMDCEINQQNGIHLTSNPGTFKSDIDSNGQAIMTIKAWSGCKDYDSFEPRTES